MKFYSFLFSLFAMFVICLFTMPALQPSYAQVTVVDKIAGNTITAEEFTQLAQALKAELAADIIFNVTARLPASASPLADDVKSGTGMIAIDTTDNVVIARIDNTTKVVAHATFQHTAVIVDVTVSGGKIVPIWIAPKDMAITITQVSAVTYGGGTIGFQLEERAFATPNTAGSVILSGTQDALDTGVDITTFSDSSVAAKGHLFLKIDDATPTDPLISPDITVVVYYEKVIE